MHSSFLFAVIPAFMTQKIRHIFYRGFWLYSEGKGENSDCSTRLKSVGSRCFDKRRFPASRSDRTDGFV